MLALVQIVWLCILWFLQQATARQPLVNDQGRFSFVDNVKTIEINESTSLHRSPPTLIARDLSNSLCRGKCSNRAVVELTLRRRSWASLYEDENFGPKSWHGASQDFAKRAFARLPRALLQLDRFLNNRFNLARYNVIQVYSNDTLGNSAEFRVFGDEPFDMGVQNLCGCTIVVIVSRLAVWFAHIFENHSFNPDRNIARRRSAQRMFRITALDFLYTGRDIINNVQFRSLEEVVEFFPVGDFDQAMAFILTPQNELGGVVSADTANPDPTVHYIDGLLYEDKIYQLRDEIRNILPQIPVTIQSYRALNANDTRVARLFYTRRGKALFQYDPDANPAGQRGARLLLEGELVHNDFWELEERLLSGTEPPNLPLYSCAGQAYLDTEFTCYDNSTLCPVLDGILSLACGIQCYLQSQYTCYNKEMLCPIIDDTPTLVCGENCYLPTEYSCNMTTLIPIFKDDSPNQSASNIVTNQTNSTYKTSSRTGTYVPTSFPVNQATEVVFGGATYTVDQQPTTITKDGRTLTLGPDNLVIGSQTISIPPIQTRPITLTIDSVTITFRPGASSMTRSSSSIRSTTAMTTTNGPIPGPTPTSIFPSFTTGLPSSITPMPTPPFVITLTAFDGSSTMEILYTPITLSQYTTLISASKVTKNIDGIPTVIAVGPGGLAWSPVGVSTTLLGFPPIPVPTVPPAPGSSSVLSSETTTTAFPSTVSSFSRPVITTAVITSDSPNGPVLTTITGTTDPGGNIVPVTTLSTMDAVSSARSLASKLSSVSAVVAVLTSSTADVSKASSAATVIKSAQSDANGFGLNLGISLPGLCFLFCSDISSVASILQKLQNVVSGILDGTLNPGSLKGPLIDLSNIADELLDDADEAIEDGTPTATVTTGTCSAGVPVTNCEVFCATGTTSGRIPSTSCFSTACSVNVICGGSVTTSTAFEQRNCPLSWPTEDGGSIYSYPGYTYIPVGPDPTDLPEGDENGDPIISTNTVDSTSESPTAIPSTTSTMTNIPIEPNPTLAPTPTREPTSTPVPIICATPQPCDASGCAGTVVNNKATCKGEFASCICIPSANTPGFSCGNPPSCESNSCAGKFANGKASCTNVSAGCLCLASNNTPGFSCGSPQSCEANDCRGTTDSRGVSTCQNNLAGCACISSKNTPGLSSGENLILADCGIGLGVNGGSTSREMMYFPGDVWRSDGSVVNKPTMIVNVPWDGSYPWRSTGVSTKFSNEDTFKVTINPTIKDPGWAGVATHTYNDVGLLCWSFHRDRVYQLDDKKWCSSAYVCNHGTAPSLNQPSPPPPPPAPQPPSPQEGTITTITSSKNYVRIYSQSAHAVFNPLLSKIKNGLSCDTSSLSINAQCSISFTCSKTTGPLSLTDVANFLINEMPQIPGFANTEEWTNDQVCKKWDTRPGHEGECLQYTTKVDTYLVLPESWDILVQKVALDGTSSQPPKMQAALGYRIKCGGSKTECKLCRLLNRAGVAPWGGFLYMKCEGC